MKQQKSSKALYVILIVVIIGLAILSIYSFIASNNKLLQNKEKYDLLDKENLLFKTLMYADGEVSLNSVNTGMEANEAYNDASISYENGEWDNVARNCEKARGYYSKEGQENKVIGAKISSINVTDKLIDIYLKMIDENSKIIDNMYEACEHFESASRYYKIYYNPGALYNDASYEMGGGEIEMMNEKIRAHDDAVKEYNSLLAEYQVELEGRL